MGTNQVARPRSPYIAAALLCIVAGLATRPFKAVAEGLASALGDALWAGLVYLLIVIAFPRVSPLRAFMAATLVAWGVEASQLLHADWLDAFRRTTPGALTIGGTFSIGDLFCYLAGTVAAFLLDRRCITGPPPPAPSPIGMEEGEP